MTVPTIQPTTQPQERPIFQDSPPPSPPPPAMNRDDFFDSLGFFGDPLPTPTSSTARPLPDCFLDE